MKAQLDLHDDARRFRPPLTEAGLVPEGGFAVSYTHLRAHET